jgi:nucleoside-diphosphate-sugar epimerase
MTLDWNTRDIVVTGAAGWLGRGTVDSLVRGLPEVPKLANPDRDLRIRCLLLPGDQQPGLATYGSSIRTFHGDLRDPAVSTELLAGTEQAVVFHCAGIVHPRRVSEFRQINVLGTQNLLDAAVAARASRAVIVSSNSPIGTNPTPDHVFDESAPFAPYMGYGRSKMEMERCVRTVQDAGKLETVTVRPPWFYGPFQPPRQTLFFEMIRDGKGPIVGSGENRRSMGYIENLAQGLQLAALTPAANGEVYWIADEKPYTMKEILDTIEQLMETEFGFRVAHQRLRLPGLASDVAFAVDWTLQRLGIYHQKIHVLSEMNKTIACSIEKAKRELGYRPTVALEEGMRRSIHWCVEQGLLRPDRPLELGGRSAGAQATRDA